MTTSQNKQKSPDEFMRIQDLLYLCMNRWHWFVISVVVALLVGFVYIKATPPTYNRTATILVLKDFWGNSIGEMGGLADLGLIQNNNTTVSNEIAVIKSIPVVADMVEALHLDINYTTDGRFYNRTLYGKNNPIVVTIDNAEGISSCRFEVKLLDGNQVELTNFLYGKLEDPDRTQVAGALSDTLTTPVGKVVVASNPSFEGEFEGKTINVSKSNLLSVARGYSARLSVEIRNDENSIVDLSFKDVSPQRAEDVLNTLIVAYNDNWMMSQNQVAVSTSHFITERLASLEQELGVVDNDISSFKSKNLLPDVAAASSMYVSQSNEAGRKIQELNFQLYMARYFQEYVNNGEQAQIPANMGLGSNGIEEQIREYNRILLERNNMVANSSETNPLVKDLDQTLSLMRNGIITSLDNYIVTLNSQIKNMQEVEAKSNSQIAATPAQATYLLSIERQQQVKESLYLFLLQKREETELSQAFTSYNARVVQPALGSPSPSAPVSRNILLIAFAIGVFLPLIVIFIQENMNTKVRGRKDLDGSTLPFVGEIPMWDSEDKSFFKRLFSRKKKVDDESHPTIVVKEGKRDVINEAFRVLRTNLEFIIGTDRHENAIIFTSFNPGSGKTFLSTNTAMGLALKGKRVIVIDGDLRRASTSTYVGSPKVGLSDYLAYRIDNIDDVIVEYPDHENLSILPVGTIPPNPSELLEEPRFAAMIEKFKEQYDYVFIDCPPIELVADTQIIARVADRTIFVIRAGLLERMMLSELENIYQERKYKNMALILNGTDDGNSGFNYGYSYGYHYGYSRRSKRYSKYY